MKKEVVYTKEPENKEEFTEGFDTFYTKFAGFYEMAIKIFPLPCLNERITSERSSWSLSP